MTSAQCSENGAHRPKPALFRQKVGLLLLGVGLCWLGCSKDSIAGVRPDSPKLIGKEKEIVAAAHKAVAQLDDWADSAEFKLEHTGGIWHVTAWRVVHPEAKGNERYVPWGNRRLLIDDSGKVLEYKTR